MRARAVCCPAGAVVQCGSDDPLTFRVLHSWSLLILLRPDDEDASNYSIILAVQPSTDSRILECAQ